MHCSCSMNLSTPAAAPSFPMQWPCNGHPTVNWDVEVLLSTSQLTCTAFHGIMRKYNTMWGLHRRRARRAQHVASCTRRDLGLPRLHTGPNAACRSPRHPPLSAVHGVALPPPPQHKRAGVRCGAWWGRLATQPPPPTHEHTEIAERVRCNTV